MITTNDRQPMISYSCLIVATALICLCYGDNDVISEGHGRFSEDLRLC